MKVLVLGATGNVGAALVKFLVKETDWEIHATWTDEKELEVLLTQELLGKICLINMGDQTTLAPIDNYDYLINCQLIIDHEFLDNFCFPNEIKIIHIFDNSVYYAHRLQEDVSTKKTMILAVSKILRGISETNNEILGMAAKEIASCCYQIIQEDLWKPEVFNLLSRKSDGTPDSSIWSKKNLTFDLKINSIEKQIEELQKDSI